MSRVPRSLRRSHSSLSFFFFFNDTAPPEISPLSLPDALPISHADRTVRAHPAGIRAAVALPEPFVVLHRGQHERSEEHTSELQSHLNLVCRLLLEKKKKHVLTPIKHQSLNPASACHTSTLRHI